MKRILPLLALASASFAGPLDNAWLKGTTDKDPLSYAPGEEMVFTVEPAGVEGEIPEGEYSLEWTFSDDFGRRETGRVPLTGEPFVYRTSLDQPGFVRRCGHFVEMSLPLKALTYGSSFILVQELQKKATCINPNKPT